MPSVPTAIGAASAATTDASGSGVIAAVALGLFLIVAVGLLIVWRGACRRRGSAPDRSTQTAADLRDLDQRSASALVRADDVVRTAEQELGFAEAQFGTEATLSFTRTLTDARGLLGEAFRLRQTLDDDIPDTDQQIHATATRILELTGQATTALGEQQRRFGALRAAEDRAVAELDRHARSTAELRTRTGDAADTLDALATRYPADALASVRHNTDQAAVLLDQVDTALGQGRDRARTGDRPGAARYARAVDEALAQVRTLLDAVDRIGGELGTVGTRLDAALASIGADLEDVDRIARTDPAVQPRATVARAAVDTGRAARTGTGDPFAALRALAEAEAALDMALAPLRAADEQARRANALLEQLLGRLGSELRGTSDFIETRRGVIGPQARTRMAEAERFHRLALDGRAADPVRALADAQLAERMVVEAQQLAQQDIDRDRDDRSGGPRGGNGDSGMGGIGGAVLGGLLLGSILDAFD